MRVVHKPVEMTAIQVVDRDSLTDIETTISQYNCHIFTEHRPRQIVAYLFREDGNKYPLKVNDWVIIRDTGCVYTCTEESFKRNYTKVDET